jgi:uncharacterized protein YaaW (UPF0174 family)
MTIAELKIVNEVVETDKYCYTSHLIYHQLLFKGCNSVEEFKNLTDQVFDGVVERFGKLLDAKVNKSWKNLPLICF